MPGARVPGSMGPPETSTEGMFRRIMAMSMPGTHLSQLGDEDQGVEGMGAGHDLDGVGDELARGQGEAHAFVVHGDAVAHGDGGEFQGVPPAMRTPALTASASLPRCRWPGTTSLAALTTPTRGRSISSRVRPRA